MNSMDDLDVNDDNGSVYGLGKQMSYDDDTEWPFWYVFFVVYCVSGLQ